VVKTGCIVAWTGTSTLEVPVQPAASETDTVKLTGDALVARKTTELPSVALVSTPLVTVQEKDVY
jgi:hypothetical protein